MQKLMKTAKVVKAILEAVPATRDDDDLLYLAVCKEYNPSVDLFPFGTVIANLKSYNLPSYKSVERARRKAQELHPELSSTKHIKEVRSAEESKYKALSKERNL